MIFNILWEIFIKINFIQLEAYHAHKYFYIIPFGNEIKCIQKVYKKLNWDEMGFFK